MRFSLTGSRVLLTGASGGLGGALARALHARGVIVLASARSAEALASLAQELGGGESVEQLPADLSDRAGVAELVSRAGRVDVLLANAALPASGPLLDFEPDAIDRALEVNLRAPMQLARALAPAMVERGAGSLAFMASLSGKVASPGSSVYSATKFGLRGFAGALREDLVGTGVGVSVVFPGFVRDAGMFHDSGTRLPAGVGTVTPEQVAEATVSAIERGRLETDVAPAMLRLGGKLAGLAPARLGDLQRRLGSRGVADQLAKGQRGKR